MGKVNENFVGLLFICSVTSEELFNIKLKNEQDKKIKRQIFVKCEIK